VIPENRIPTHPGVVLSQEFLAPLGISQVALAAHLGVPVQRINPGILGKPAVGTRSGANAAGSRDETAHRDSPT
jgi:plasmid maintenance system antidote protein VapI